MKHAWEPSYIQKLRSHPALYGAVKIKGGEEQVDGYYPPVMTKDEFEFMHARRTDRAKGKATSRKCVHVTNLFSGLLTCGYCGSKMVVGGSEPSVPMADHNWLFGFAHRMQRERDTVAGTGRDARRHGLRARWLQRFPALDDQ